MSLRKAIYDVLKTGSIPTVYNAESRITPSTTVNEYVVLEEMGSFVQGLTQGEYIFRVSVHVQVGDIDKGDNYLQWLGLAFKSVISDGVNRWNVYAEQMSSWSLEELDKTISRKRILVIPAWG